MERDFEDLKRPRTFHGNGKRPVWKGPVPDRYYYIVRNKRSKHHPSAFMVPFSDTKFEPHVRQIVACMGGQISLIESDVPLPIKVSDKVKQILGKMLSHGKIAQVKEKLFLSHDRSGVDDIMGKVVELELKGVPFLEEEVFI